MQFIESCVIARRGSRVQSSAFFAAFRAWSRDHSGPEWSNKRLTMEMERRGYERFTSNVVWWVGIELTADAKAFAHGSKR
ncbi:hypothetical protein WDM22_25920 [Bradyrhizobium septentrionale]|uniref:hypothetical protein n=1 Tax=Bradyrhizobium septentrionale TaxID=1404411 RepID=UPI0030D16AC4